MNGTSDNQHIRRCWDENAHNWHKQVRRGGDTYREYFNNPAFFEFVGDISGKTILDMGCGEGYNTRLMARKGAIVTGVDISPEMINFARQEEERAPLGITYYTASMNDLSIISEIKDISFDMVLSTMAIMDAPHLEEIYKEAHRVLKPGGEFAFNITHPCFITKGYRWNQDEKTAERSLSVSHYFDHQPDISRWKFLQAPPCENIEPFTTIYYQRSISEYINGLLSLGFTLTGIQEPRPTEEVCEKIIRFRDWAIHAAIFLYIKAKK